MTEAEENVQALKALILDACWPGGSHDGFPTSRVAEMIANNLVGAGVVAPKLKPSPDEAVERYLSALEGMSPSDSVLSVIAQIRAERTTAKRPTP